MLRNFQINYQKISSKTTNTTKDKEENRLFQMSGKLYLANVDIMDIGNYFGKDLIILFELYLLILYQGERSTKSNKTVQILDKVL